MDTQAPSNSPVPTLNVQDFSLGTPESRKRFVADLKTAYQNIGFVVIKGHNISHEQQKQAYAVIEKFFRLPVSEKLKYQVRGSGGAWRCPRR